MGVTEDSVRRAARVLIRYMSPQEAQGFANGIVTDAQAFGDAYNRMGQLPPVTGAYSVPRVEDLPPQAVAHTTQLLSNPLFSLNYPGGELKMVELGKLIAIQHWVDTDASDGVHGVGVDATPTLEQLLSTCLPLDLSPQAQTRWEPKPGRRQGEGGLVVYTHDNSYSMKGLHADAATNQVQISFGTNANLLLVRSHGDRYALANGYHRAWLLRSKGVVMVPAVVVPAASAAELTMPGFIQLQHVTSPRPPIVDDFIDDQISTTVETRATLTQVTLTVEISRVPRLL